MDTAHVQPTNVKFSISILSNSAYQLMLQAENASLYSFGKRTELSTVDEPIVINQTYKFGEEVESKLFKFTIYLTEHFDKEAINQNLSFVFNDYKSLITTFRSTKLEPINREASIIEISIKGGNTEKLSDYLNELTSQYLLRGMEKKNQIAENTIRFINSELIDITDSLTYTEGELQDFRVSNEFMDMDFKSAQVFESMKQYQDQKAQLIVKAKYYRNLQDYLKKNQENIDDIVIPSSMGIEDPLLTQLISGMADLYAQRATILYNSSEKNPQVAAIDQRIRTTKKTILENIQNIVVTSEISIQDIDGRIALLNREMNRLPQTQRRLVGIQRKYKLNDALYTFLLQKRSEAQIAKASNLPDNEIVDNARSGEQVFPKKSLNYLIALVLGLLLPEIGRAHV